MRVLLVQTAFLGDLVLTLPLLAELRRRGARTTVVTTPPGGELFAAPGPADEVLVFDKARERLPALLRLGRRLREPGFDAAIAAQRSHRTALLLRLSRTPRRIGFEGAPGAWAYTRRVPHHAALHAVRRYLMLGEPLGVEMPAADPRPVLEPGDAARAAAERLLRAVGAGPPAETICIAPGSVRPTKRWLPERFSAVADAVWRGGRLPLLVGSHAERELCARVAAGSSRSVPVLAGRTGIRELAAVLERAVVAVCNDSGTAHVASAVGTPVISVFGPTVPGMGYAAVGPDNRVVEHLSLDCRPCSRHGTRRCPLGHFRCMRELEAGRVIDALEALLGRLCPERTGS